MDGPKVRLEIMLAKAHKTLSMLREGKKLKLKKYHGLRKKNMYGLWETQMPIIKIRSYEC